jgi:hypothetical protein
VVSGIYLRRQHSIHKQEGVKSDLNKIYTEYFNQLLEIVKNKQKTKFVLLPNGRSVRV